MRDGGGQVYISNSGGVDSTVLSHLVHSVYPDVVDVYCDTGLEYPELREFIMSKPNVIVLKPEKPFTSILAERGYPIISKEIAMKADVSRRNPHGKTANCFDTNSAVCQKYGGRYSLEKWRFLIDAPFRTTSYCCNIMKKNPCKKFERKTGMHPYLGLMTEESNNRKTSWLHHGCNAFEDKRPTSNPLSFWTKSDVLEYLHRYNIPYASVYGDIVCVNGKYVTTGCKRTGCVWCGYGVHLEKEPNKMQSLAVTHPQLYDYCMRGGKFDADGVWVPDKGLGMAKVFDFINVKWWNDGDEAKRDEYRAKYKQKEEEHNARN